MQLHSRTAPIRSVPGFEQMLVREAADLQWARDAAARIAQWLPRATAAHHSPWTVRVDVPSEVVHLNEPEWSVRAHALVALLVHDGWSAAEFKNGRFSMYAAREALEVITDEGERFSPMYTLPGYNSTDITIDLSRGARRGRADGTVEWIPLHRIHVVRYLYAFDASAPRGVS